MAAKLSNRAIQALEVLRAGGKFRKALETQRFPVRREVFETRLLDSSGRVVAGVGVKTRMEMEEHGLIRYQHPHDARSSAWPEEWIINEPAAMAA